MPRPNLPVPICSGGFAERPAAYHDSHGLFPNLVSLFTVVRAGSRNEVEPGKSGFAHLFEHLMFRGTPEYSPDKISGGAAQCWRGIRMRSRPTITRPSTRLSRKRICRAYLSMEADRFQHLALSWKRRLRRKLCAVLGRIQQEQRQPDCQKLTETMRATAFFTTHTYRHTTMGFLAGYRGRCRQ